MTRSNASGRFRQMCLLGLAPALLADYVGVRTGVTALDDIDGGAGVQRAYGGYFRNAHWWEVVG